MTYKINILENANKDLNHFRRNDKNSYIKVFDFIREMMIDPNQKARLVYTIYEYKKEVDISSSIGHYE